MGPCPFRHGYSSLVALVYHRKISFNGAMPFQAWILLSELESGIESVELQWGHALSGMDTAGRARRPGIGKRASMGPCPFRHGYSIV